MKIAFYAPLKAPDHPTPSGDRAMARALLSVLGEIGSVDLVSTLRSRDGLGDSDAQDAIFAAAEQEIARLSHSHWDAWVTYHNYYKAPDLLGPAIARKLSIPYVIVEASRAKSRLTGPWARFAATAEAACDAADVILYMTQRDLPALASAKPPYQRLEQLRPFLDIAALPPAKRPTPDGPLLTVAMLREGDKMQSFKALAMAMHRSNKRLIVLGDGPARARIVSLFAASSDRITFVGLATETEVQDAMREAGALVWPGVNEAFGMVYLEAQALGLRCIAEDRPGVRDVVGPTGYLCPPGDPAAFAAAIAALPPETPDTIADTRAAMARHLRGGARAVLMRAFAGVQ